MGSIGFLLKSFFYFFLLVVALCFLGCMISVLFEAIGWWTILVIVIVIIISLKSR